MNKVFRFSTTIACHLANGAVRVLKDYEVQVEAEDEFKARASLRAVAFEQISDAGDKLLDAPLDDIQIVCRSLTTTGDDNAESNL